MNTIKNNLINLKSSDIELFSLNNINTWGKVVELYDGDTCTIIVNNNGNLQKFNCRLLGLDTPEMKPPLNKPNRNEEILNAHKCRNRLLQLVTDCKCEIDCIMKKSDCLKLIEDNKKVVFVKCHEFDKYGRLLVELFINEFSGISINNMLVNEGYAKSYDGGTKDIFTY